MLGRTLLRVVASAILVFGAGSASALDAGEKGPGFTLAGTDGKVYGLATFKDAKAVVIVFTCNECPFAKAYQYRYIELAKGYE